MLITDSLIYTAKSEKQIKLFFFHHGFVISTPPCHHTCFHRFILTRVRVIMDDTVKVKNERWKVIVDLWSTAKNELPPLCFAEQARRLRDCLLSPLPCPIASSPCRMNWCNYNERADTSNLCKDCAQDGRFPFCVILYNDQKSFKMKIYW